MLDKVFHLLTVEYSLILATTQEHFQAVKDIRNDVIVNHYPDVKETKKYIFAQDDEQSFIYLLQHNATQKYVGSVRIFFANEHTPSQKIPMEKDLHIKDIENLTQVLPICEISRFALLHNQIKHDDFSELQLRTYLSLALMCATRINVFLYHYTKMFAIMERSLHRILKRQSVLFEPIGDAIDFHGVRYPFVIKQEDFFIAGEKTEGTMGQLTKYYLKELCKNSKSFWEFIDNNPYLERSDIHLDRICQFFKEHGDDVSMELLLGMKDLSLQA
jgi:N-acyl amino acid synthase of PEP-CTERM/exosortase system